MAEPKPSGTPEPTEIAGRYQIIKKLGAGAFGTVFKAKDKILGRMVAIKTIRMDTLVAAGASMEEMLKRFTREAQVAAQLKHPNIVTVYDISTSDDLTYLAMEFIDGVGLDRIIATEGQLSIERAASIAAQVADGLEFAHKAGVVHRDIKPANIMIEPGDRVKVTDFGIAKPADSADHLTMTGSLLGTPSYMSPEQARGGELDGRSDLFAVGCVLYEMAAGKKAFRGDSITGLIFKIITEDPPPLRELRPDLPEEYLRIVTRALAKTADARYQNGGELKADLDAFVRPGSTPTVRTNETPTAPGVAPMGPPAYTPTLSGTPTAMGAGATQVGQATAAAPPGVAPTQISAPSPPPPPPRPAARGAHVPAAPPPAKGGGAGLLVGLLVFGLLFLVAAGVGGWYFFLRKAPIETSDLPSGTNPTANPTSSTPPSTATSSNDNGSTPSLPPVTGTTGTTGTTGQDSGPAAGTYTSNPPVGTTRPPVGTTGQQTGEPPIARTPPPPPPTQETTGADTAFLDEEPPQVDSDIGGRVAGAYSSSQGSNRSGYSAPRNLSVRKKSPPARSPLERAAIATLRHVSNAQVAYHKKAERYGSLTDLKQAQRLFLDVPVQARDFTRKNYRFSLELTGDGFKVVAQPMAVGLRPFYVDENEFIEVGSGDDGE